MSPATMLLKDFLKEHRTVHDLKKEVTALTATVNEQASQIQKLSAQVQASEAGSKRSQTISKSSAHPIVSRPFM